MNLSTSLWVEVFILLLGTIYAWYNWYLVLVGKCTTCSIDLHKNPFKSKCFMGAVFFTLALLISIYTLSLV